MVSGSPPGILIGSKETLVGWCLILVIFGFENERNSLIFANMKFVGKCVGKIV